jgi:hypothetical protein
VVWGGGVVTKVLAPHAPLATRHYSSSLSNPGMATWHKDVLYPGDWHLADGRVWHCPPAMVEYLQVRLSEMLAAGVPVPLMAEHQLKGTKLPTPAQLRAGKVQHCLGWVDQGLLTEGPVLECEGTVPDAGAAKSLESCRFVSPAINENVKDGTGRVWPGPSIYELAATPRPIQVGLQKPFQIVRLSLDGSLAGTGPVHLSLAGYRPVLLGTELAEIGQEERELGGDAARQKAQLGQNPPSWAVDEAKWEEAKKTARRTYSESDNDYWPSVVAIYKKMGGKIRGKTMSANGTATPPNKGKRRAGKTKPQGKSVVIRLGEEDEPPEEEEEEEEPQGVEAKLKKALECLGRLGLMLGEDTPAELEQLLDRLIVACETKEAHEDEDEEAPDAEVEEVPDNLTQPVPMSANGVGKGKPKAKPAAPLKLSAAESRLLKRERDDLLRRLETCLRTGRMDHPTYTALKEQLAGAKPIQLSFTDAGDLAANEVVTRLGIHESLPAGAYWSPAERVQLSADGGIEEAVRPLDDAAKRKADEEALRKEAAERGKNVSRQK